MGDRIKGGGQAEDALVARVVGKGSRKGSSVFSRAGDIMQRPPAWAGVAALRGGLCYLSAAALHLPIKALVGRRHPPKATRHQLGPVTSSFPSGHAASDLAFAIGAAQELPLAFLPLSACTIPVHWSLVRKRAHYPSDVLAGGALGIAVALAAWKLWPPRRSGEVEQARVDPASDEQGGDGQRSAVSANGSDRPPAGVRPEAVPR